MDVSSSDLAARLRALLDRQGFTIAEAARQAGMQKQQLYLIVRGDVKNPGILTVRRILDAIGVDWSELFPAEE